MSKGKKSRVLTPAEAEVLERITNPLNWIDPASLIDIIHDNPSLRGFTYGYVAEQQFVAYLERELSVTEHSKDDDHQKTKSDRTFVYNGRSFTVQLKSLQTHSIREVETGTFRATVQNDASDRRKVRLPNGDQIETTCYVRGEYDILAVSIQPFVGKWNFAFKKNKDLQRSSYKRYTDTQREYLLATSEIIFYPLQPDSGWTTDLLNLLDDPDLGRASIIQHTPIGDTILVETPITEEVVIVEEYRPDEQQDPSTS